MIARALSVHLRDYPLVFHPSSLADDIEFAPRSVFDHPRCTFVDSYAEVLQSMAD